MQSHPGRRWEAAPMWDILGFSPTGDAREFLPQAAIFDRSPGTFAWGAVGEDA